MQVAVADDTFNPAVGAGTYTIDYYYTDSNGCSGNSSAQMTVVPVPVTSLNPFGNVCSDAQAFVLTGGSPSGGIYIGQGITNGIFDPAIGAGTYSVSYYYEDSLGCSTGSNQDITVDICTGITNIISDATVSLYPNPADKKVNIDLNSDDKINSLELYNSSGAIVYGKTNFEIKSLKHFEIDLSLISPGVYLLRLYSENGIINKKLMVE